MSAPARKLKGVPPEAASRVIELVVHGRRLSPKDQRLAKKLGLDGFYDLAVGQPNAEELPMKLRALECLARWGAVGKARKEAGVSPGTWRRWLETDAEFVTAVARAVDASTDDLEHVGLQRARKGSDNLLMFFLRSRRPEKYSQVHKFEHTGKDGGPVEMAVGPREALMTKLKDLAERERRSQSVLPGGVQ